MKKTFVLTVEGKNRDRLMEAVRHQVNKYLRRERGKTLPEGADYWNFACRFGLLEADAQPIHLGDLRKAMDTAFADGADAFYVEILAFPDVRGRRADTPAE